MRRIGSGSRAIWCSRPACVRRTNPARSSTFTCFETALNDMSKGWARSVTRAAPFASRWTISRRVGSESAAKARSRTGVVIYSTRGLNIATGPPVSSDRSANGRDPNSLSHRRRVAARLLGIGGTEAYDRVGVDGPLGRADINAWPRLVVEMPVAVGAPHQHRGQPCAAGAMHVGRDVAEAETDAPIGGEVRTRIVDQEGVMQRELAGAHRHEFRAARVEIDRDRLAARQQIV